MNIIDTGISDIKIIEPKVFQDSRGYFFESYSQRNFEKIIGEKQFVQDNESKSSFGVVRGLHFQNPPYAQCKLVRVVQGAIWDIAVDIRKNSPTFGQYVGVELNEENKRQLYIPHGFAHGFSVLTPIAVVQYKCDEYYAPDYEGAIAWNDPMLAIDWKLPQEQMILSPKDTAHPLLSEISLLFNYNK